MKIKSLFMGMLFMCAFFSCDYEKEEYRDKNEDLKSSIQIDVARMCECYKEGRNDSQKFMACSSENEKIRSKYAANNELLKEYDKALNDCMNKL